MRIPLALMAILAAACSSADSHAPPPPGSLRVSVTATGPLIPGPGYFHLYVDSLGPKLIWADSFMVWTDLPAEPSTLRINLLRPHCAADSASKPVTIPRGDTADAAFVVSCWDAYGLVRVDLPATGNNLPLDLGVEVVGVVGTRAAANTAGLGFPIIPIGPQTVRVFDVPANCIVSDSNPQHVTVPLDSIVLTFGMTCT